MKCMFAILTSLVLLLCVPQSAQGGSWRIEVVDDSGDVGTHTSLAFAFGSPEKPCVSYHDETNGALKLACRDAAGDWIPLTIPDPEAPVGDYSSLAIGLDGSFHISYRRGVTTLSVLKYAHSWDGSSWTIETVDTQAQGVGHSTSLALDSWGDPHIAHRKWYGKQAVKYARGSESGWERNTVLSAGGSSYYFSDTSLVLDSEDRSFVAFLGGGADAGLDLARKTGRKWKTSRLASFTAGDTVSMVLEESPNGTGIFHIVYSTGGYPDEHYELNYVYGSKNADGSLAGDWNFQSEPIDVWDGNDAGFDFASLAIDRGSGDLHLSYFDYRLGVLKYAFKAYGDPPFGSPEIVDSSGDVGLYTSIALDASGNPHIAYYDATNGSLRFAAHSLRCIPGSDDCDDLNECTVDSCDEVLGTCVNTPVEDALGKTCNSGTGICCGGGCVTPVCTSDADCDDGEEWTQGKCVNRDTCDAACQFVWLCGDSDGYCPEGCDESNDPDCDAWVPCDEITDRKSCRANPFCEWDARNKRCVAI